MVLSLGRNEGGCGLVGCKVSDLLIGESGTSDSKWLTKKFSNIRVEVGYDHNGIRERVTKSAHFLAVKKSDGVDKYVKLYMKEIV